MGTQSYTDTSQSPVLQIMRGFQVISLGVITLVDPLLAQLKFSGGVSSSGSSSSSGSKDANKKLFGITSGNEAIDGGIVGLGLGALGATVLGGALNGGGGGGGHGGCGRRKRDAQSGEERFFLPSGGSCTCGRKKRQAPGEDGVNTKFFNLGGLLGGGNNNNHCGSCCYNGGGFNNNNGGFNSGNYNNNKQCQCNNNLTFRDQYGNTHGACRRSDNTGRTWCYTTGWHNQGCRDLQSSNRYQQNPWSYNACNYSG